MNPIIIKDRIVELMKEHGDNQVTLAKKIGISKSSVSKWFKDPGNCLRTGNLMAIAKLYNVNIQWLLGYEGEPKEPETPEHVSHRSRINDKLRKCSEAELAKIEAMIDLFLSK